MKINLLIILLLVLFSCKKEEEQPTPTNPVDDTPTVSSFNTPGIFISNMPFTDGAGNDWD
ncbi:MAG: hypothetical protein SH856_11690 [Flavobacteriales bacterium]|nr:hypothetical protein [Flavobacteriales bacterium]